MLLIPLHNKVDWRNPPLGTILLIVLNVLAFLLFQLDDTEEEYEALSYYGQSGLAAIELPAALTYAERVNDDQLASVLRYASEGDAPNWIIQLQTNTGFIKAVRRDEFIEPGDERYEEWRSKREHFTAFYESITYVGYGLRTAEPTVVSLFSHMFLHAGFLHLFGNMVFLFAVGFLVESTLDTRSYLVSYILMGLGSALFDFVFRSDELIPGIGASGAISGLMGAYAILYGVKQIRFFYFIGIYFDYIKLPAIVLLPLWVGNEIVQLALNTGSNVNYLAHIGGLCSGALIAVVMKKKVASYNLEHVEMEEHQERGETELQKARELMTAMKPGEAQKILCRLRLRFPDNREVLTRYYDCCRMKPASEEYHELAHAIFALAVSDSGTDELVRDTFNEYLKLAKPTTRMSPALVCTLARRFTRQKAVEEAELLIRLIVAKKIRCSDRRELILDFATLLEGRGREEDRQRYLGLLQPPQSA